MFRTVGEMEQWLNERKIIGLCNYDGSFQPGLIASTWSIPVKVASLSSDPDATYFTLNSSNVEMVNDEDKKITTAEQEYHSQTQADKTFHCLQSSVVYPEKKQEESLSVKACGVGSLLPTTTTVINQGQPLIIHRNPITYNVLHKDSNSTTNSNQPSTAAYNIEFVKREKASDLDLNAVKTLLYPASDKHQVWENYLTIHPHGLPSQCGDAPFKCGDCGAGFSLQRNLTRHSRIHTGEKPFLCGVCRATFTRQENLNRHARTHTGEKPFKCTDCGAVFSENRYLKTHTLLHTGGRKQVESRPTFDPESQTSFDPRPTLDSVRRYFSEKPYKCEECGSGFTLKRNLQRHMRIHTGERPYVCLVCSAAFGQKGHLDKHSRVHGGEPRLTYGTTYTMVPPRSWKATRVYTRKKQHNCGECGSTFSFKRNLKRHEQLHMSTAEGRLGVQAPEMQQLALASAASVQQTNTLFSDTQTQVAAKQLASMSESRLIVQAADMQQLASAASLQQTITLFSDTQVAAKQLASTSESRISVQAPDMQQLASAASLQQTITLFSDTQTQVAAKQLASTSTSESRLSVQAVDMQQLASAASLQQKIMLFSDTQTQVAAKQLASTSTSESRLSVQAADMQQLASAATLQQKITLFSDTQTQVAAKQLMSTTGDGNLVGDGTPTTVLVENTAN